MQASFINRFWTKVELWRETARQRQALIEGGQALAKDMGVSYATLTCESQRSCWDAPLEVKGQQSYQKPVVSIRSKKLHKMRFMH
jgi:uncharacterized protein YjiS (DUF1127 family)